jgi:hypothetical protein
LKIKFSGRNKKKGAAGGQGSSDDDPEDEELNSDAEFEEMLKVKRPALKKMEVRPSDLPA